MENLHRLTESLPSSSVVDASQRFPGERETKGTMENQLHVDVEEARQKGNSCFRKKRWEAAAEHYTKCIDAALVQLKKVSSIKTCLVLAYSNRAETRLQLKEFELALDDSNQALQIDSDNLKALYRKGRALLGLRDYAIACEYL